MNALNTFRRSGHVPTLFAAHGRIEAGRFLASPLFFIPEVQA
jgi:hypothetical protein